MKNKFQRDLEGIRRNQYVLYLLVFSLVTIVIWVGISIARSQRSSQVDPDLTRLAEPLNPNLNQEVIRELEQKRTYSERELSNFSIIQVEVDESSFQELAPVISQTPTLPEDETLPPADQQSFDESQIQPPTQSPEVESPTDTTADPNQVQTL